MSASRFAIAALAMALAACQSLTAPSSSEMAQAVADADWSRATPVKIVLRDAGFLPQELRLAAGRPYRLTLENQGVNNHYFNAPEFFATIATRRAEVPRQGEIYTARIDRVEIHPAGGAVDLWFVPLVKGRYRAHCHLGNHAEMGVEGTLVVE